MQELPADVTLWLEQWRQGEPEAGEKALGALYDDLRRIARQYLCKERPGHSFKSTDLVHETYLRLNDQTRVEWQNREQFFAIASILMQRTLADRARRKHAQKRGAGEPELPLDDEWLPVAGSDLANSLDVGDALARLEQEHQRRFKVVQLKFFLGLTIDEVALALDIAPATVKRDWDAAVSFLEGELSVN